MTPLPKAIIEQFIGVKYLSSGYSPKMYKKNATLGEKALARLKHMRGKFTPIGIQQLERSGLEAGLSGFAGHPIYGKQKPITGAD